MALTDVKVRTTKSQEKAFKLSDEKGLFLYVAPNGSKYWGQVLKELNCLSWVLSKI